MKPLFTGTGTALITPFKNGEIDWDALDNLVESQIAGGVSALIAAGTTGEPSTMTWDEHIEVIRFVAERAKDRACVIAGTGSNCTREVIHAANVVKDFGVAAQLVVTPYYNKSTQEGLVAHYTEIAEKTSLPIVVYNVPSRTGVNIQPATLQKICRLPQVVAVKEANADVAQAMEKINLVGDNAAFYCGNDDLTIPLMVLGFQGVISVLSNVMPAETSKMTSLALSGNWAEASKIRCKVFPPSRIDTFDFFIGGYRILIFIIILNLVQQFKSHHQYKSKIILRHLCCPAKYNIFISFFYHRILFKTYNSNCGSSKFSRLLAGLNGLCCSTLRTADNQRILSACLWCSIYKLVTGIVTYF